MPLKSLAAAALLFISTTATTTAAVRSSNPDISAQSTLGRKLLAHAVPVDNNNNNNGDARFLEENDYFLNSYSIKFQGCHHVQQWNEYADEEDDVRIMTKRLARFRLCPSDQCSNEKSAGCNSKYGDYIVDMDTFVASYLEAMEEDKENLCNEVKEDCEGYCGGGGDENYECAYDCYDGYDAAFCLNQQDQNGEFNAQQYAQCSQLDIDLSAYNNNDDGNNNNNNNGNRRLEEDQVQYYVGAYCADQGGEVRLGIFTDDTCTTFVNNGAGLFYSATGYALPYSQDSLVSNRCFECQGNNGDGNYYTKEVCSSVYAMSGKCETRMAIDYPNESSCNYIEGVKIIRQDGVIRTSTTRKSKSAAVAIGLFTTLSVLLAAYVFYLRTKLSRAQINLAAASQPLA